MNGRSFEACGAIRKRRHRSWHREPAEHHLAEHHVRGADFGALEEPDRVAVPDVDVKENGSRSRWRRVTRRGLMHESGRSRERRGRCPKSGQRPAGHAIDLAVRLLDGSSSYWPLVRTVTHHRTVLVGSGAGRRETRLWRFVPEDDSGPLVPAGRRPRHAGARTASPCTPPAAVVDYVQADMWKSCSVEQTAASWVEARDALADLMIKAQRSPTPRH